MLASRGAAVQEEGALILSVPRRRSFGIESIFRDYAIEIGVALEHVTATWPFFLPEHYAVAGVAAQPQVAPSHPVLVTLRMPDFVPQAEIEQSLLALASSISERAQVPLNAIFINHEQAHSGRVFDAGKLVRW